MKTEKSFIGKKYTPIDNSYEVNISDTYANKSYLAGTNCSEPKVCEIVSEPFVMRIISKISNRMNELEMVTITYDGCTYLTMFNEAGVIKSILDGKVAIQVQNEREFKLLMEHYESKGWKEHPKYNINGFGSTHHVIEHNDSYLRMDESNIFATIQYKIIPFADFASEIGIQAPVFILRSEDGVDLYEGDFYYHASNRRDGKQWFQNVNNPLLLLDSSVSVTSPDIDKAFSAKEAAEKWISEANKPQEIEIQLSCERHLAIISKKQIKIRVGTIESNTTTYFEPNDISSILHAYQSL